MPRGKPKEKPFVIEWWHPIGSKYINRFDSLREAEERIASLNSHGIKDIFWLKHYGVTL